VETAARAPFGALVKLANDKTGYRVSAAGLQAGWQRRLRAAAVARGGRGESRETCSRSAAGIPDEQRDHSNTRAIVVGGALIVGVYREALAVLNSAGFAFAAQVQELGGRPSVALHPAQHCSCQRSLASHAVVWPRESVVHQLEPGSVASRWTGIGNSGRCARRC
jgi:hypothetical protein